MPIVPGMVKLDVKSIRSKLGWTQQDLADYLGVDRSTISRMEVRRKFRGPTARILHGLMEPSLIKVLRKERVKDAA